MYNIYIYIINTHWAHVSHTVMMLCNQLPPRVGITSCVSVYRYTACLVYILHEEKMGKKLEKRKQKLCMRTHI
jgi:hypothetical protein